MKLLARDRKEWGQEVACLRGVHGVLPHVDFAEALEEGEQSDVQPLVRPLCISLLVEA